MSLYSECACCSHIISGTACYVVNRKVYCIMCYDMGCYRKDEP